MVLSNRSRILEPNPGPDDLGILRAEDRLRRFVRDYFVQKSVILNTKDKFAKLIILQYHDKFYHGNHQSVINAIRRKYWIVGLR